MVASIMVENQAGHGGQPQRSADFWQIYLQERKPALAGLTPSMLPQYRCYHC